MNPANRNSGNKLCVIGACAIPNKMLTINMEIARSLPVKANNLCKPDWTTDLKNTSSAKTVKHRLKTIKTIMPSGHFGMNARPNNKLANRIIVAAPKKAMPVQASKAFLSSVASSPLARLR